MGSTRRYHAAYSHHGDDVLSRQGVSVAKTSSGALAYISNTYGNNGTGVDPLGDYYFCPLSIVESNVVCRDGDLGLVILGSLRGKSLTGCWLKNRFLEGF